MTLEQEVQINMQAIQDKLVLFYFDLSHLINSKTQKLTVTNCFVKEENSEIPGEYVGDMKDNGTFVIARKNIVGLTKPTMAKVKIDVEIEEL